MLQAHEYNADVMTYVGVFVYGLSLILLYLASTFYHLVTNEKLKYRLKIADHSAIYILIAGTYTPLMLISLKTQLAYYVLGFIWLVALTGIGLKVLLFDWFKRFSLMTYLLMGWVSLVVIYPLMQVLSRLELSLLAGGGFAYSFGVIFYLKTNMPYHHAIWHLFVLLGTGLHFSMVYLNLVK